MLLEHLPFTSLQQPPAGDTHRHNLVICVVGDTSEHTRFGEAHSGSTADSSLDPWLFAQNPLAAPCRWLEGAETANWDLAVIYYGELGAAFICDKCMHIELGYGAKWKLVYQFTQSGPFAKSYVNRYTQVLLFSPCSAPVPIISTVTSCYIIKSPPNRSASKAVWYHCSCSTQLSASQACNAMQG